MFCEKCWREIAHDSIYCSYCGKAVELEKPERPNTMTKSGTAKSGSKAPAEDDCIRPYMPKKHCHECGKELPGSNISDYCAMCTIRQRNRELEERRKNDDASYATRDRYDTSDEFDQSVFANSSHYYKGEGADRFVRPDKAGSNHYPAPGEEEAARQKKFHQLGFAALVLVFAIFIIGSLVMNLSASSRRRPEPAPEPVVSIAEEPSSSYEEMITATRAELLTEYLQPVAEEELFGVGLVESTDMTEDGFSWEGIYLSTTGIVRFAEDVDAEFFTQLDLPFTFTMIASDDTYLPILLEVSGNTIYDRRELVDSEGMITTQEGADFFEAEIGDEVPIPDLLRPDELPEY